MTRLLRWGALALLLAVAAPLAAQDAGVGDTGLADTGLAETGVGDTGVLGDTQSALNYADWESMATRAEAEIEARNTTDQRLEEIRSQLAKWRAAFLGAQSANSARIGTLRQQLEALGPAPAAGASEPDEISKRRQELADQLVRLQAPGIAAEEAYRRADGLIREIDRTLRERQADELLQLWPSPVNPGNWPEAAIGLRDTLIRLWDEATEAWADPQTRAGMFDNLPLILVLMITALALVVYVRRWVERYALRLLDGASARGRNVWSLLASLGVILFPTLGVVALATALVASGMLGEIGASVTAALPGMGFVVFAAAWLGARAFPKTQGEDAVLPLPTERRAEGRFLALLMGLVLAAQMLANSQLMR